MLLYSLSDVESDQGWTEGKPFDPKPSEPVVVKIQEGYEDSNPSNFMSVPPVISNELYEVFKNLNIPDVEFYDAILASEETGKQLNGYKAYNLTKMIHAADMKSSKFAEGFSSRDIDASFDSLTLDESKIGNSLMFRLKEYTSAVIVHRSVKEAIEEAGIKNINFTSPSEYLS
jgi:hypothetical protein